MQAGFLCLESGITRSKNSINVAIKNLADFSIAALMFWVIGFGLMFGQSLNGLIGTSLFFQPFEYNNPWPSTFFIFQLMFCGAAVTIISGATAERLQFWGYLIISLIVSSLVYPIYGHWVWGGTFTGSPGWLEAMGFVDFA
ncbi:MAG: Amt family ammonium transporter, partial [Candidatus Omnitrophota bacterium]